LEPAFAGWQEMSDAERSHMGRFRPLLDKDGAEMLADFQALQIAPGVDPLPHRPNRRPRGWPSDRPGSRHFCAPSLLRTSISTRSGDSIGPVLFALSGRSHPDYYARMGERLAGVFPDFIVEVFPDRHHFDPPHRIEPARVAASLRSLWARAERG
jgi:hypothetical protein